MADAGTRAAEEPATVGSVPAELVAWPADDELRQRLGRAGVPVLMLVDVDADPPTSVGVLEDWIRLPAQDRDLRARAQRLARISARLSSTAPILDPHRVLHREGQTAVLSSSEARLTEVLLASLGRTVARAELEAQVWADKTPAPRSLDTLVYRLRSRLAPLGVRIRSVRGQGFVMDIESAAAGGPTQ